MKTKLKKLLLAALICVCAAGTVSPVPVSNADSMSDMEGKSSELKKQLNNINQELLEVGSQIAENETKMAAIEDEIVKTQEQLAIAKKNEEAQYGDMKVRIQYIYENDSETLLALILSAEDMSDFVNKVDFVQTLSDYDRKMLEELEALSAAIKSEEQHLKEQQAAYVELEDELSVQREKLKAKAAETSTDLVSVSAKIQAMKEEQAKEQERKRAQEAAAKANSSTQNNSSSSSGNKKPSSPSGSISSGGSSGSSGGGGYKYPSGPGVLTPSKGVNWFNGHRETWYSQKVLPGNGLRIPGRHVASDGTIRDANGYICVASSDYEKGTIVQTSLGPGKVYDTGCASGTIDIYTDW